MFLAALRRCPNFRQGSPHWYSGSISALNPLSVRPSRPSHSGSIINFALRSMTMGTMVP